jgi:hypothetical protein
VATESISTTDAPSAPNESRVFLNSDGYVEMVFVGPVLAPSLRKLADQARGLIERHGPIGGFIDGRHGNIKRDVESLSIIRHLNIPKLRRLVILMGRDDPLGVHGPTVIMSILTAVFGFRPIYMEDEREARQLAASK